MRRTRPGFTIMELTIAMLFVTFILIFCVTTLVQIMRMYDKGSAIKQMSQATRLVNDELARSIRSATSTSVIVYPTGPLFDRICINDTMYLWNVLYENDGTPYSAADATRHKVNGRPVGLVKLNIDDTTRPNCSTTATITRGAFIEGENEILGGSARIVKSDIRQTSDGRLYTLDFSISTYSQPELSLPIDERSITPAKQTPTDTEVKCKPGDEGNYCFVNPIELTVYAANISE